MSPRDPLTFFRDERLGESETTSVSIDSIATDVGAAEAFAQLKRDHPVYDDREQQWYAANNNVHERRSPEEVKAEVIGFANHAVGRLSHVAQLSSARGLLSAPRLRAVFDLAKLLLRVRADNFDADPWIAGVPGGVLDLRKRHLVAPATIVTWKLGTVYDPDSTCQIFERTLDQVFAGDRDVTGFVQRVIGYTLTGRTSEQSLFVLVGDRPPVGSRTRTTDAQRPQEWPLRAARASRQPRRDDRTGR